MTGYTPIFGSVFKGSLAGKFPDLPLWLVILALADKNGHVDCHPSYIAMVSGIPVDLVADCIQRFCEPDPHSRTPDDDGRRLTPLEGVGFGWAIVNHGKYREKARLSAKSAREVADGSNAERVRDRRGPPVTAGDRLSNANANSDAGQLRSSSVGDLSPSYSERAPPTLLKSAENRKAVVELAATALRAMP